MTCICREEWKDAASAQAEFKEDPDRQETEEARHLGLSARLAKLSVQLVAELAVLSAGLSAFSANFDVQGVSSAASIINPRPPVEGQEPDQQPDLANTRPGRHGRRQRNEEKVMSVNYLLKFKYVNHFYLSKR